MPVKVNLPDKVATAQEIAAEAPKAAPREQSLPRGWFSIEVTGGDGSTMTIVASETLTVREEMRLGKILPNETQFRPMTMEWIDLAVNIRRINGDPIPLPNSEAEAEAIVDRVGDAAMRTLKGMRYARLQALATDVESTIRAAAKN